MCTKTIAQQTKSSLRDCHRSFPISTITVQPLINKATRYSKEDDTEDGHRAKFEGFQLEGDIDAQHGRKGKHGGGVAAWPPPFYTLSAFRNADSPRRAVHVSKAQQKGLLRWLGYPTLRRAWSGECPGPQYAFKMSMFNVSCNSH